MLLRGNHEIIVKLPIMRAKGNYTVSRIAIVRILVDSLTCQKLGGHESLEDLSEYT